ncbi:hypothetical protein PGQ11_010433 [Apiospora arundinis]|uniref:F-box domain-containing protein n=1 Tax=Apiospora arundinis TaxID=335852 RepID=A0ABR2IAF8_9PEZI
MSQITDLPTEILLGIEEHLDHPVLFSGDALACTCVSMWERLGGTSAFRRAAIADRIRTLRADEICLDVCQVEVNEELDRSAIKYYELIEAYRGASYTKKDVAWLQGVARKGMGPTNTDTIADAYLNDQRETLKENGVTVTKPDHNGFPREVHMSYTLDDATSKTFLNRAIMGCMDLDKIEQTIDTYAEVFPEIFTGACCKPLLELAPIYTAVRAKRPFVMQMLVNKELAPTDIVDRLLPTKRFISMLKL